MCLSEVQKASENGREKREEKTSGEGIHRRATFREGLERFVKYYVLTKENPLQRFFSVSSTFPKNLGNVNVSFWETLTVS